MKDAQKDSDDEEAKKEEEKKTEEEENKLLSQGERDEIKEIKTMEKNV